MKNRVGDMKRISVDEVDCSAAGACLVVLKNRIFYGKRRIPLSVDGTSSVLG